MDFKNIQELETYLWSVLSNRHVQMKYQVARDITSGIIPLKISKGEGARKAWARTLPDKMWVSFPRKTRNKFTVLHELAHLFTPTHVQKHGREFCRTYQHLVLIMMGRTTQKQLKAAMKLHNCKYSKTHTRWKNPPSQEEKDIMLARLLSNNHERRTQVSKGRP